MDWIGVRAQSSSLERSVLIVVNGGSGVAGVQIGKRILAALELAGVWQDTSAVRVASMRRRKSGWRTAGMPGTAWGVRHA